MRNKLLISFMLLLAACNKDPEYTNTASGGLAFYNASQILRDQLRYKPVSLILLNTDDKYYKPDSAAGDAAVNMPYFSSNMGDQQIYPTHGGTPVTPPWMAYMRVRPGVQKVSFLEADSSLAIKTEVTTRIGENTAIFLMDSLGTYHTKTLTDDSKPALNATQLRILHASADAGTLMIKVNGQWLLKDSLHYRDATGFFSYAVPDSLSSALYRIQVSSREDTANFIFKSVMKFEKGRSYTMIMNGYLSYYSEPVEIQPDFRLSFIRNK